MEVTVTGLIEKIFRGDTLTMFERFICTNALVNAERAMPVQKAAKPGAQSDVDAETAFVLARLLIANDPKIKKIDAVDQARIATIRILARKLMVGDAKLEEKVAIGRATKSIDDGNLVRNVSRRIKLKKIRAAVKALNDSSKKDDSF